DLPVTVRLFDLDAPVGVRDRSLTTRHASLEQLLHARQPRGDVIAGDTTLVECAHRQLRTRLADRLRGDDAHRLTDVDQLATGHRTSVAAGADTGSGLTGEHAAHLHLVDAQRHQFLDRRI